MVVAEEVDVVVVQRHEEATASNVRLGSYGMDRHCPTNEFRCYRVRLESTDEDRLFLLGLTEFIEQTRGKSSLLRDVLPTASAINRVASFSSAGVDLRSRSGLELIVVAAEMHGAPLIAIDGNHRAMAQFLTLRTVERVPGFVCVHAAIGNWNYVPRLARTYVRIAERDTSRMPI